MDETDAATPDRYQETIGRLVVELAHRLHGVVGPVFAAGGLKPRQLDLLRVLAGRESTTQQELVSALRVDPSVLVGLLNDLEDDGAVRRIRDPEDRRRHLVEVTPVGISTLDSMLAAIAAAEGAAFAGLGTEDAATLRRLLLGVRDDLAAAAEADGPCD